MASLNLSTNGPSIKNSYNAVINANISSKSATFAHWALFYVQAPLANAFKDSGNKESVLKVEDSGEGELDDLIEDFNEGRIQFAFVKVKDPNSALPKNVLIAWCGGSVPERTKGYFTSHMSTVSKVLQGYHVQITARSTSDLTPESIVQKVADASGAKYSGGPAASAASRPPPPAASKPVFTPTSTSASRINPLVAARSRKQETDDDGWGADAPPVTRSEIQKVESAYKPTRVNMAELTKVKQPSQFEQKVVEADSDVVRGGYEPIGKVDINAIRAQAKNKEDYRPVPVKGAYEPIGKVDIAAIRARAQKPEESVPQADERPKSLAERTAAFTQPGQAERLTSLPKPKVANKFGGASTFTGTKPALPGSFGAAPTVATPPVGVASRTFADQRGKTPAQIWAEKKGKTPLAPPVAAPLISSAPPIGVQKTGEWKSGYTGKSWSVSAPAYSRTLSPNATGDNEPAQSQQQEESESVPVASVRDRFKEAQPIGMGVPRPPSAAATNDAPPPLPSSTRPSDSPAGGFALPGLPTRSAPPPAPEPAYEPEPEREPSPIRVPVAVARSPSPPPPPPAAPVRAPSPARAPSPPPPAPAPAPPAPAPASVTPAIVAGVAAVGAAAGAAIAAVHEETVAAGGSGLTAIAQYDYERAEDNELELKEGETVYNIEQVDEDWWFGFNTAGESGLFPSNYVELIEGGAATPEPAAAPSLPPAPPAIPEPEPEPEPAAPAGGDVGQTAIAQYDYEAAEDNELSFPEGGTITNVEFPDEDWWFGHYQGDSGLFPANYVELSR